MALAIVPSPGFARCSGSSQSRSADEVARLVGEDAPILRADIDKVTRMPGAVCEAGTNPVAAFDK